MHAKGIFTNPLISCNLFSYINESTFLFYGVISLWSQSSEQKHSPAQEAVIRVHARIAEIGFEPGAAVVARLLVHSQQIGCLLGKGGFIISEMRRATGASIRIFTKDQVPKCASYNDEVVQVIMHTCPFLQCLCHLFAWLLGQFSIFLCT